MIFNYFKVALRFLLKNKVFSFINVFGLATSMSVCLLLIVLVTDQHSYDEFHAKKDRIYRLVSDRTGKDPSTFATSPARLAAALRESVAGVETVVELYPLGGDVAREETVLPLKGLAATAEFFDVFDFGLLAGDSDSVLREPYSVVLTEASALALFGDSSPVGESLRIGDYGDFTVTGVAEDPPANSHLDYEMLLSYSTLPALERDEKISAFSELWNDTNDHFTYVLMQEGAEAASLQPLLDSLSTANYPTPTEYALHFSPQALTDIALSDARENGVKFMVPVVAVYFLSVLALLVMVSAGFNYTNLSLARALARAREVGIRKTSGASRRQVFSQFMGEAMLLSAIAFVFALVLLELVIMPGFRGLSLFNQLQLTIDTGTSAYLLGFVFCLGVGLVAGMVPASYLSAFQPVVVLKGFAGFRISGMLMRKILIVVQFVLSLLFIIMVVTVFQQLRYMLQADYGFNQSNVINVRLQGQNYATLMNELSRNSSIQSISASSLLPGTGNNRATEARRSVEEDLKRMYFMEVDANYIPNMELALVAGSNFPPTLDTTTERYVILNETAVQRYGYGSPAAAIGQTLLVGEDATVEVLGVIKDFHYREMTATIDPFMLRNLPQRFRYLNLRVMSDDLPATLAFIESVWQRIDPVHPLDYGFYDRQIAETYAVYTDLVKVVGLVSVLSISIACLGLLGISALHAEARLREVGIRKVMGATDWGLLLLLSKGFLVLLAVAMLIALPLAWVLGNTLLQTFAYRIGSPLGGVVTGTLVMLLLGVITIGSQTFKAAVTHPGQTLRHE